jgi:translation elongation factor P/translation initiation factor 5A
MAMASELERGTCFMHNNHAVRVARKEVVNCGTHSHTKLKLFVVPAFGSGGAKTITLAHNDKVDVVEINKKKGHLISISGNAGQVMDSSTYETFDAEVADEELKGELQANDLVMYVEYQGRFIITEKLKAIR